MVAALLLFARCLFQPAQFDGRLHGIGFAVGDQDGRFSKPKVGDENYWIAVRYEIAGESVRPFKIRFEMADLTYLVDVNEPSALEPGKIYTRAVGLRCPADGVITARVTIDPDGTSGDPDRSDKSGEVKFTPAPPANAIDYYSPRKLRASISASVEVGQNAPLLVHVFEGVPTSETSQTVLDVPTPPFSPAKTAPASHRWPPSALSAGQRPPP